MNGGKQREIKANNEYCYNEIEQFIFLRLQEYTPLIILTLYLLDIFKTFQKQQHGKNGNVE
jgi:hypothetical protein